jgi:hypothetical protein
MGWSYDELMAVRQPVYDELVAWMRELTKDQGQD